MRNKFYNILDKYLDFFDKYRLLFLAFCLVYILTRRLWEPILYDLPKNICFVFCCFGILNYFLNLFLKYRNQRVSKFEYIFLFLIIIYFIYIIINGIYFNNAERFFKGMKEYIFFPLIIFSSIYYFQNIKCNQKLFRFINLLGIIISLFSIYEIYTGTPLLPLYIDPNHKTRYFLVYGDELIFRARTFFGSFQVNGLILGLFSLINFILYNQLKKKRYLIYSLINFIGLNCSCARGPLVAYFVSLVFSLVVLNYKKMHNFFFETEAKNKKKAIILFVSILICFFLIISFNISFGSSILEFFFQRIRSIFNWSITENSNTTRLGIWVKSFDIFSNNPIMGIGIASTGSGDLGTISIGVTESGILKRLVETGIIGFFMYYMIFFLSVYYAYKSSGLSIFAFLRTNLSCISCILLIMIEDCTLQITEDFVVSFLLYSFIGILFLNTNFLVKRGE